MASRKGQKEARRRERELREEERRHAEARSRLRHRLAIGAVLVIAAGLITVAAVSGGGGGGGQTANHDQMDHSSQMKNGPVAGQRAPAFSALDVTSGKKLTLADLRGKKSLLFFSEGVNCQACMVQAADLQKSSELKKERIELVSVTTDSPSVLRQAAGSTASERRSSRTRAAR